MTIKNKTWVKYKVSCESVTCAFVWELVDGMSEILIKTEYDRHSLVSESYNL